MLHTKKLNEVIQSHELRFDSLRDPSGLADFKRMLNTLTQQIDSIHAEKESQYTTMKAVVRIMEDMDVDKGQ